MTKKITINIHGRAPGESKEFIAINETIALPDFGNSIEKPEFHYKAVATTVNDSSLTIKQKMDLMKSKGDQQKKAKEAYDKANSGEGVSVQDQVRSYAITWITENFSDKISVTDHPSKFRLDEKSITLQEAPNGDYFLELQTVFG